MARLNHRTLHRKLESLGYEVYKVDYSQGNNYFQIERGDEWHEYGVKKIAGKKTIELGAIGKEIYDLVRKHYESQDVTLTDN